MRLKDVLKLLVSPHWGDKGITRRGPMAALSRISTRDEVRLEPPGLDVTGITTDDIERIEEIGRAGGAVGAMINGAGGGGSICLLCEPGRKIEAAAALRAAGYRVLPFSICLRPAEAWTVPSR